MYQSQMQTTQMAAYQYPTYPVAPPAPSHRVPSLQQHQQQRRQYAAQPMLVRPRSNPVYPPSHAQSQMTQSHKLPHLCHRSNSQPSLPNMPCPQQSQSGIVLQSLPHGSNMQQNMSKYIDNASMQSNLNQFAKYSQYQLQTALSAYPAWLQKEYVRRLQRQYEEMYVVDDPKILHSSSICPRKLDQIESDILSESEHSGYLSAESATLSPSPYAYSPAQQGNFTFDETTTRDNESKSMLTCFEILDHLDLDDETVASPTDKTQQKETKKEVNSDAAAVTVPLQTAEKCNPQLDAYRHQVAMQQYYQQAAQQQKAILLQQQQQQAAAMQLQQRQRMMSIHQQQQQYLRSQQQFVNYV